MLFKKLQVTLLSDRFRGDVNRFFPGEARELIFSAYQAAVANGGALELDFSRPAGASFNPRPARIAHILLYDAEERSPRTIVAAILATAREKALEGFDSRTVTLARKALAPPGELLGSLSEWPQPALISCALWLDRARHAHQTERQDKELFWKEFVEATTEYLTLAEQLSDKICKRLQETQIRLTRRVSRK